MLALHKKKKNAVLSCKELRVIKSVPKVIARSPILLGLKKKFAPVFSFEKTKKKQKQSILTTKTIVLHSAEIIRFLFTL